MGHCRRRRGRRCRGAEAHIRRGSRFISPAAVLSGAVPASRPVTSSAARLVRHEHQLVGVARDLLKRLEIFRAMTCCTGLVGASNGQTRIGLTDADLLQKMLDMKKATSISIRELQQNLKQVMGPRRTRPGL